MAGCIFLFVGVAIQSASQSFSMFIAGRFFVGFGNSMASNSAPLLLTELCHPQHRGRVTTVYNQLWDIGSIAATWITFGTFTINNNWSWRIPSILQAFPTMILFCFIWVIPESPRWLISKDRHAEALTTLAKYHSNGDETDLTVQFEYREIRETLRLEFESKKSSSFLDFLRTKGNRYRLLLVVALGLFSQWSGNVSLELPANDQRVLTHLLLPGSDQLLLRARHEEHRRDRP
jgi:MFS family permease